MIYFKAPWGTLFELQEWPNSPAYMSNSSVRLYHEHPVQRPGVLYGIQGLDHAGYSVSGGLFKIILEEFECGDCCDGLWEGVEGFAVAGVECPPGLQSGCCSFDRGP